MEIRQIKYFVKVAQMESFSSAAKSLYISQSTLSQQVKQLEGELGVELLVRSTRSVLLSDYGRTFLPLAKQLLDDEEICRKTITDVRGLEVGELNIGTTSTFSTVLMETMRSFTRAHPGIVVNVRMASVEDLMAMLVKKEIDFALSFKPDRHYDDIDSHELFHSELCVVVNAEHPLAQYESVSLKELSFHSIVLPARGMQARDKFDQLISGSNLEFRIRGEMNDMQLLLNLVLHSHSATVAAVKTVGSVNDLKRVRIDSTNTDMAGCFHLLRGGYCSVAAREFLKQLTENNAVAKLVGYYD